MAGTTKSPAPAAGAADAENREGGARRIRLTLSRLDPWSVMKLSFIGAIACGIALVVAVAIVWQVIDSIGLWDAIDSLAMDVTGGEPIAFLEYLEFNQMLSFAIVVAVLNVVLMTALGTLAAFLYNLVAQLLGGLNVTFTED